ncbi:MAG: sugar phosphate isomerase/epimerase [Chloroflexota bacterium]|nr:sugar phosphate isomerase/epimerase [Chloroflexota bacterium]
MKLGVFIAAFAQMEFEPLLDYVASVGVTAIEIPVGGYVGDAHLKPAQMLHDDPACADLKAKIAARGLSISALSAHANPLHPNPVIGEPHREAVKNGILMAEKLGVETFITFSGCPGGAPGDMTPNWVTCPWPPDFSDTVKYQWEQVMIPYWREINAFAEARGVRIAIEMHPGFCVYSAEHILALRDALGSKNIGANFDPSHLFWQGVDPVFAIRKLGAAIFHFHAKDTVIDPINSTVNGVLDTKSYSDLANRSWVFRTVGYGHGESTWRDMVSNLRLVGYDGTLSIEHEDGLMSQQEGFEKAAQFLNPILIKQAAGYAFWA